MEIVITESFEPCRISMGSFTLLLFFSAAFYMLGAAAAPKQPDYRFVEVTGEIGGNGAPRDVEVADALLADASESDQQRFRGGN